LVKKITSLKLLKELLMSDIEQKLTEAFVNSVNVVPFNEGDTLPFGYYEPTSEGQIFWLCNYDGEAQITSVFACKKDDGTQEREVRRLPNMEEAIFFRDELIRNGWQKMKTPEMTFTYKGKQVKLNREKKRKIAKELKKMKKANPAADSSST